MHATVKKEVLYSSTRINDDPCTQSLITTINSVERKKCTLWLHRLTMNVEELMRDGVATDH
jgi:hypothetical protein